MNTPTADVTVSPVNMKGRQEIGIRPGDTVRVHQKIQDRGKTRIQLFEGLVLARKHGNEAGATFTVRKVIDGIGVERIFPLYSPLIDKIEIVRRSKVRRAKLYHVREKVAREIKRQMRRMRLTSIATESEAEAKARAEAEAKQAEEAAATVETEEVATETEESTTESTEQSTTEVAEKPAEGTEDTTDETVQTEIETSKDAAPNKEGAADTPEADTNTETKTEEEQKGSGDTKAAEGTQEDKK